MEMAARAGISRNTLRAVEAGDPATGIGTYLRIMSILGVGGVETSAKRLGGRSVTTNSAHCRSARFC
jgi:DNA-binding XRE family transcriptional regulator